MITKYKHISFDLDGTLVHTAPEHRHIIVPKVVTKLGGKIKDENSINKFWFEVDRDNTIEKEFCVGADCFWKEFRTFDTTDVRSDHTWAYEDVEPALRKLKELGKTVSIITGSSREMAKMEIKKLNGSPYDFHFSITDSKFGSKPDPRSLHHVLSHLKIEPKDTLYIGNSDEDAHYAKNAGVDFLHIDRKEHNFDLKEHAIDVIYTLEDLFKNIENIDNQIKM